MGKRHEVIGLNRAIRFEWMQKTTNLLLTGLDTKAIRRELHEFLANEDEQSDQTRVFAVNNLMKIWGSPDPELTSFRDALLAFLRNHSQMALAVHWGMISVAYPFWFNVARQVGRLLALQDQVTQAQIINRLKEQYGDRQTVSRRARYVIRSFIAWGVLKDSDANGCYKKVSPVNIVDANLAVLMFESALLAIPDGKCALRLILNNPALFPFQLPVVTGDFVSQRNARIDVIRYGLDDELLKLKGSQIFRDRTQV